MVKEKMVLLVSALLMITVIATICLLTVTMNFEGTKEANDNSFQVEYDYLNKTLTRYMRFEQGEKILVKGVNLEGELTISIDDIRGNNIYKNRSFAREKLSLLVPQSDRYVLSLVGSKAKDSVTFVRGR